MKHRTYGLDVQGKEEFIYQFIEAYWPDAYESRYAGGYMRVFEDYSFLKSNNIMVCIRVDSSRVEKGELDIEVIAGGARSGLIFDLRMGSEARRIRRFEDELISFCRRNKINVEVVKEG